MKTYLRYCLQIQKLHVVTKSVYDEENNAIKEKDTD